MLLTVPQSTYSASIIYDHKWTPSLNVLDLSVVAWVRAKMMCLALTDSPSTWLVLCVPGARHEIPRPNEDEHSHQIVQIAGYSSAVQLLEHA